MKTPPRVFHLVHAEARRRAAAYMAEAPDGHKVTVEAPRRKESKSRKFHAMVRDIARQCEWAGKMRTEKQWKHLLVSGHAIATEQETELVAGIEGELIDMRESTAEMDNPRSSSLIEYTAAFGAESGVVWSKSEAK